MNYINTSDSKLIRLGDTCVIYISEHQKSTVKIEPNKVLQTKFGHLNAMDLIGHPYGIKYDCKKGWILPLRLTPELWTQILPHRTQILYQADISMILLQLDIKPGSIVFESGTGSGSLSHAILRACIPNGHLYTFDISSDRVKQAREEFVAHELEGNVTVHERDITKLGFPPELEGTGDACLLDIPETWNAIEHAHRILKPDGSRLCTFSPCIEQVQQNVAAMERLKMRDIITLETLYRPFDVREQNLRLWSDDLMERLAQVDQVRFENLRNSSRGEESKDSIEEQKGENRSNVESGEIGNDRDAAGLERALSDPKAPFHPRMLPRSLHSHIKHHNESVSHSGFLTFSTKRR